MGFAQHPLAQSASDVHAPVINCLPAPLPTFSAPGASGDSVCARSPPPVDAGAEAAGGAGAGAGAAVPEEETKPQPVLPCWKDASGPEQIPIGEAQQPEPQSALDRQAPVMNWPPAPLPMFLSPDGSGVKGEGMARERDARARRARSLTIFDDLGGWWMGVFGLVDWVWGWFCERVCFFE